MTDAQPRAIPPALVGLARGVLLAAITAAAAYVADTTLDWGQWTWAVPVVALVLRSLEGLVDQMGGQPGQSKLVAGKDVTVVPMAPVPDEVRPAEPNPSVGIDYAALGAAVAEAIRATQPLPPVPNAYPTHEPKPPVGLIQPAGDDPPTSPCPACSQPVIYATTLNQRNGRWTVLPLEDASAPDVEADWELSGDTHEAVDMLGQPVGSYPVAVYVNADVGNSYRTHPPSHFLGHEH